MAKIINPDFVIDFITKEIKLVEYPTGTSSEPINDYPTAVEMYNYFKHVWEIQEKQQLLNKKLKKIKR